MPSSSGLGKRLQLDTIKYACSHDKEHLSKVPGKRRQSLKGSHVDQPMSFQNVLLPLCLKGHVDCILLDRQKTTDFSLRAFHQHAGCATNEMGGLKKKKTNKHKDALTTTPRIKEKGELSQRDINAWLLQSQGVPPNGSVRWCGDGHKDCIFSRTRRRHSTPLSLVSELVQGKFEWGAGLIG